MHGQKNIKFWGISWPEFVRTTWGSKFIKNFFKHSSCRLSAVPSQWPTEGRFGVFKTPPSPRNSEDIGGVLDCMSKKNRRLDFLLQFAVFSYGCSLLNKGFF